MNEWQTEFFHSREEKWTVFTQGTLEECLQEIMDFRAGQYSTDWTQARLITPKRGESHI